MTEWDVVARMIGGLVAGGLIGLERSYHGRAAGLRTYALVCFGAALLIAATEFDLLAAGGGDTTRVIQGIVTGIGFLGAGVIVKEGFTVRGLTTAASIWVVAAIGVAIGAGHFLSGGIACLLTLAALALLRFLEDRLHAQYFVHCQVSFQRDHAMDEEAFRAVLEGIGFTVTELSYRLDGKSQTFEYRGVMWSAMPDATSRLEKSLLAEPRVASFRISPSRD